MNTVRKTIKTTAWAMLGVSLIGVSAYSANAEETPAVPDKVIEKTADIPHEHSGPRADKEAKFEQRGREMFEKTDTDKDGFLTLDEMEANHRARMEEMFKRTDVDSDGKLSPEELKKGRESMRDKFRERFKDKENRGFERPEPRGETPQPDGPPDSP
jgi:hypothetical protein